MRFALLYAGVLTAAMFAFANGQAHALPNFSGDTAGQSAGGSSGDAGSGDNDSSSSSVNPGGSHEVPEPASIALLACALLAAGAAGRRSREKQTTREQQLTGGDCL